MQNDRGYFAQEPKCSKFIKNQVTFYWAWYFLPLSPPGWRGIVVTVRAGGRAGGRSGGRLPDLRNPYLCNRLMDFLRSKFYGIV